MICSVQFKVVKVYLLLKAKGYICDLFAKYFKQADIGHDPVKDAVVPTGINLPDLYRAGCSN